jgi:hypothetical protein
MQGINDSVDDDVQLSIHGKHEIENDDMSTSTASDYNSVDGDSINTAVS